MEQAESFGWPEPVDGQSVFERLRLRPALLDACRAASLRMGGPRLHHLGVSSAISGEGRTSIAEALAVIQATDYRRRALLIEMDLEHPSLAERLGVRQLPGLSEFVHGIKPLAEVIQPVGARLAVITAGGSLLNTNTTMLELLSAGFLTELQAEADVLIADLPPLLGSSFGRQAAEPFEHLVLVVRAGVTPLPRVREAIAMLPQEPALLLNGVQSRLPRWMQAVLGV